MPDKQKTYSHLLPFGRIPSEYDIVSSQLLYYSKPGFAIEGPHKTWYETYQKGAKLQCQDWEMFRDPRATTYAKYTSLQLNKEVFVARIFRTIDHQHTDTALSPAWIATLNHVLPPLRYVAHACQMIASYIGQMAPSGKISIVFAMQAADHVRMIECIAYRMAQLRQHMSDFGKDSMDHWLNHTAWQPMRKLLENVLITYDWTEAWVVLNHCFKTSFDTELLVNFAHAATRHGDTHLASLLTSLHEDALWHHEFTQALLAMAREEPYGHANQAVISQWQAHWQPLITEATTALVASWQSERN